MAKKLSLVPDEEMILIGIVSQEKDYRLCFEINKKLGLEFQKTADLEITPVKQFEPSIFSNFKTEENDDAQVFHILSNKGTAGLLIPEQKQMDYFLLIKGTIFESEKEEMISSLREIQSVLGVYEMSMDKLKSRQNLIF